MPNNIRFERVMARMSQEELASSIGVSASTIYDWENEVRPPKSDAIVKMADIFNCSTDWLLARRDTRG